MTRRKMLRTMYTEKATVRIGKQGPTDLLINEISKQLDKRETVKVKLLKTALINEDAKEIAQKIADETQSEIIELRGHTFTVYRPKKS